MEEEALAQHPRVVGLFKVEFDDVEKAASVPIGARHFRLSDDAEIPRETAHVTAEQRGEQMLVQGHSMHPQLAVAEELVAESSGR